MKLMEGIREDLREDAEFILDHVLSNNNPPPIINPPCNSNQSIFEAFQTAEPEYSDYSKTKEGKRKYNCDVENYKTTEQKVMSICSTCPFRQQCLTESVTRINHERIGNDIPYQYDKYLIFGGRTAEERKQIFSYVASGLGYTYILTSSGYRWVSRDTYDRLKKAGSVLNE